MAPILSVDTLQVNQFMRLASAKVASQGKDLYHQGHAIVEQVDAQSAHVRVIEQPATVSRVYVRLHATQVTAQCNCRRRDPWSMCQHQVAALLALQDYLVEHPPSVWRMVLDQTMQPNTRRVAPSSSGMILFSVQQRFSGWAVVPYTLAGRHLPAELRNDPARVVATIVEQELWKEAKPLRQRVTAHTYANASAEAIAAANLSVMSGSFYGYAYGSSSLNDSLFALLPNCLVFLGDEEFPFQTLLRVAPEPSILELVVNTTDTGMQIVPEIVTGEQRLAVSVDNVTIVNNDPFWLLADDVLTAVYDPQGLGNTLLQHPNIEIPRKDQTEFLERYLLPLAESIPIRGAAIGWETVDEPPVPRLYLSDAEQSLQAELRFGYGDYELPYEKHLPIASTRRKGDSMTLARVQRQPDTESAVWQSLPNFGMKRGTEPSQFALRRNVAPIDFLVRQVPRLLEQGYEIYGEEDLAVARVNRSTPTISFAVSSGIDWFDLDAVVNYGELEVPLKTLRRAMRKRERYVKLADGSIGEIPEEWVDRYHHLFALGEEQGDTLRMSQHHLTLIDQVLADADRAEADAEFQQRRERLRTFANITPHLLPEQFDGTLRPYQKAGYDWLHFLHEYEFGGCLADDMGIGKTVQTLALLQSFREQGHATNATLIVMPRSLLFNWEREAARFAPSLRCCVHADKRTKDVADFDNYDLVFTTYGVMLRDIEILREYRFHYVILDEAQAVKNPLAETSRAARTLNCDHRLTLTGTPVENSTLELWSQFAFLNPGLLGNLDYFREEFVNPIERKQDVDSAQFLRKMVYPFILRRTKDQVELDLPPISERILVSDMEPAQRKIYNKQRDYYRNLLLGLIETEGINDARMKILEGLLRLRQICNHPRLVDSKFRGASAKFDMLFETLETLQSEGHKALVFSQFVQMLSLVRDELDKRKLAYSYLDGRTRDREAVVDQFQNNADIPFFLISLKAGGVGLNLTAADYVIHVDPWWNPAVEMQATDRSHRIGQDKPVFVYKLVMRDSVEEKILQLQERKRDLVDQLITTEGGLFKSLTQDDIKVLFT